MDTFDYIIVGAGSAGCVLANRLSEGGKHSVLLVEAGGSDRNPLFSIPLLAGVAYWHKPTNWNYETTPQAGLDGRTIKWPRGKVLGGSSTINGMMYMRGNAADYNAWQDSGLTGWSYEDVLPYFRRSESNPERPHSRYHGQEGPLHVAKAKGENALYRDFLAAGRAVGHPVNDDFNGADQEGLGFYDFNTLKGRRVSSATAGNKSLGGGFATGDVAKQSQGADENEGAAHRLAKQAGIRPRAAPRWARNYSPCPSRDYSVGWCAQFAAAPDVVRDR